MTTSEEPEVVLPQSLCPFQLSRNAPDALPVGFHCLIAPVFVPVSPLGVGVDMEKPLVNGVLLKYSSLSTDYQPISSKRMPRVTNSPTALMISTAIKNSEKTQASIAAEAGFARPNVLSMIKKGEMRVPIDRVPALARATDLDPLLLLHVAMSEYMPETWQAVLSILTNAANRDGLDSVPTKPLDSNACMKAASLMSL